MSESINIENEEQNLCEPPRSIKRIAGEILTCPAAWCFTAVWVIAAIYLLAVGRVFIVLQALALLIVVMSFCLVTVRITKTEHKTKAQSSRKRKALLLLQIAVIVFFIFITFYTSIMSRGIVKYRSIPLWRWPTPQNISFSLCPFYCSLAHALRGSAFVAAIAPSPSWHSGVFSPQAS